MCVPLFSIHFVSGRLRRDGRAPSYPAQFCQSLFARFADAGQRVLISHLYSPSAEEVRVSDFWPSSPKVSASLAAPDLLCLKNEPSFANQTEKTSTVYCFVFSSPTFTSFSVSTQTPGSIPARLRPATFAASLRKTPLC